MVLFRPFRSVLHFLDTSHHTLFASCVGIIGFPALSVTTMLLSSKTVLTALFTLFTTINAQTCRTVNPPRGLAPGTTRHCCDYARSAGTALTATCADLEDFHHITLSELVALNPSLFASLDNLLAPVSSDLSEGVCNTALRAQIARGHHYECVYPSCLWVDR